MAVAGTRVVMKAERFMVGSGAWMVGLMMKALMEGGQRRMIGDLCGT